MVGEVQVSAGAAHNLGYHVVWCPKYRRPVLAGAVAARCDELVRAKCAEQGRLPTLWSRSYFVATVGPVSAATVRRYIDTQNERPWRKAPVR